MSPNTTSSKENNITRRFTQPIHQPAVTCATPAGTGTPLSHRCYISSGQANSVHLICNATFTSPLCHQLSATFSSSFPVLLRQPFRGVFPILLFRGNVAEAAVNVNNVSERAESLQEGRWAVDRMASCSGCQMDLAKVIRKVCLYKLEQGHNSSKRGVKSSIRDATKLAGVNSFWESQL